ncbi:unnamed protein product [Cunninghamella blakesleeana]
MKTLDQMKNTINNSKYYSTATNYDFLKQIFKSIFSANAPTTTCIETNEASFNYFLIHPCLEAVVNLIKSNQKYKNDAIVYIPGEISLSSIYKQLKLWTHN